MDILNNGRATNYLPGTSKSARQIESGWLGLVTWGWAGRPGILDDAESSALGILGNGKLTEVVFLGLKLAKIC